MGLFNKEALQPIVSKNKSAVICDILSDFDAHDDVMERAGRQLLAGYLADATGMPSVWPDKDALADALNLFRKTVADGVRQDIADEFDATYAI